MNNCALYEAERMPGTKIKTLVADDSPFILKILAQILKGAGNFELIGSATDGRQALRYASILSPNLILMDLHMPYVNGIEATRAIKGLKQPPVIIIITSDGSSYSKESAENAGADAFVVKNQNLRTNLLGALQNLFEEKGTRCAPVAHRP